MITENVITVFGKPGYPRSVQSYSIYDQENSKKLPMHTREDHSRGCPRLLDILVYRRNGAGLGCD